MTDNSKSFQSDEDHSDEIRNNVDETTQNTDSEQERHSDSIKAPDADQSWLHSVNKIINKLGMNVFIIASLSVILYTFLTLFIESRFDKSVDTLLTVAALGLIVVIASRAANPYVFIFSAFIVGALIIPSKDIFRFYLIASGSGKKIEDFYDSNSTGPNIQGRLSQAAEWIVTEVEDSIMSEPIDRSKRSKLIKDIEEKLLRERDVTISERVRSQGAVELLKAISNQLSDGFGDFLYKHGAHEKFIEDLRFLRSEDLISFAYDDLDSIELSSLGRKVLEIFKGEIEGISSNPGVHGDQTSWETTGLYGSFARLCTNALQARISTSIHFDDSPDQNSIEQTVYAGPFSSIFEGTEWDREWVNFSVSEDGEYEIIAMPKENNEVDPVLVLFGV